MPDKPSSSADDLVRDLQENYRRERDGVAVYSRLAEIERDPAKQKILRKLADAEGRHAQRWATLLRELDGKVPDDALSFRGRWELRLARWLGLENAIRRQETAEDRDIGIYERQRHSHQAVVGEALEEIQEDASTAAT